MNKRMQQPTAGTGVKFTLLRAVECFRIRFLADCTEPLPRFLGADSALRAQCDDITESFYPIINTSSSRRTDSMKTWLREKNVFY